MPADGGFGGLFTHPAARAHGGGFFLLGFWVGLGAGARPAAATAARRLGSSWS